MSDTGQLTVEQVAKALGLSEAQVYRRIRRGDLAAALGGWLGKEYFIAAEDLAEYIEAGQPLTSPAREKKMLTVPDVAAMTGFTKDTVRRLCYEGKLLFVRGNGANGHLRIPIESVKAYMNGADAA